MNNNEPQSTRITLYMLQFNVKLCECLLCKGSDVNIACAAAFMAMHANKILESMVKLKCIETTKDTGCS